MLVAANITMQFGAKPLFENVNVGRHSKIRRAIIDKNVVIPDHTTIGYDRAEDLKRGFTITESGIVVVPRKDR